MSIQPTTWGLDPVQQQQLGAAVAWHVSHGWRVESAPMPGQVVVVSGRPTNHILHLLLTVFTFGLWGVIWLLMTLSPSESRAVLTVNPDGSVTNSMMQRLALAAEAPKVPWYKKPLAIVLMVLAGMCLLAVITGGN